MSITFTNIYLTYKKGNYYVYKIYGDDYSIQHSPDNRSQRGRCLSPPPSERLPTHFRAPGDTMGEDVQYGSRYAINTWHVSTVGIYWQIQTR